MIYDLQVIRPNKKGRDLIKELRQQYERAKIVLDEDGESATRYEIWSSYEKDLSEFSRKHPDAVFQLTIEEDDFPVTSDNFFRMYVKNGKIQHAPSTLEIKYPEFKESLIQRIRGIMKTIMERNKESKEN